MKSKIPRFLLTVTLLSALSFPAKAAENPFSDVPIYAWYYDAVANVYEKGWMNGIAETSFSPDTSLTRAMLSVILWRIEGCPAAGSPADFTDTNSDDWFADSLSWCVESGAFAGYPDGSFRPDEAVTREQLAVVFYRYTGASAQHSESEAGEVSVTNCCEWAADACTWANAKELFTNALGTLDLCAQASRAEIANLLDQYFKSELTEGSFESLGYLLYTPSNAMADMPLIVYLHGGHGKGSDLSILTDTDGFPQYLADNLLGDIPAYVLIPQLPADQRGWKPAAETVVRLIDRICTENSIDRSRISLTGHSMGGTGTWDLALLCPETFSRIAPMSGSIQTTPETLSALKNMPVWAFVGDADVVVKPESSKQFISSLKKQNPDAQITVFPETDHVGVPRKAWLENAKELLDCLLK